MSYKDQIDQATNDELAQKAKVTAQQATTKAALDRRADEAAAHIEANKVEEIGLTFKRDKSRISLTTGDYTIIIDVNLSDYGAMILQKTKTSPAPVIMRGTSVRLKTLADVDRYIVQAMKT
jgi:hypothetical protein